MRALRVIHRWIGLVLALIVAVVAASGGLLLMRTPYYRAMFPVLAQPIAAAEVEQQGRLLADIDARFAHDGLRIVKFPRPSLNAFQVWLADEAEAFVDPRTGEIITRWTWRNSLPAFLFQLHVHLLLGETGEVANGIAALFVIFLGLTGLILWWPGRASAFRLRRALPRSTAPGELLRSHAASGLLALGPVLVFVGTGAALIFYTPLAAVLSAALDASPPMRPDAIVAARSAPRLPWSVLIARVREAMPDGDLVMHYPGQDGNAVARFRVRLPGEWNPNGRSYVLVNPYDGTIVQTIDSRTQGLGTRMTYTLYALHAAKVGGAPYVAFAAVGALGLTWLAVGATWAYVQRLKRTWRAAPRRAVQAAAPDTLRRMLSARDSDRRV